MQLTKFAIIAAALAGAYSSTAVAQQEGQREVLLSADRGQQNGRSQIGQSNPAIPAVGLIRTADFAVRSVTIEGDTREADLRNKEIRTMVENTIKAANARGIELSFGTKTIEDLNLQNFEEYASSNVFGGGRPDTSRISFLVKISLDNTSTLAEVEKRMDAFQNAVKPIGRAQFSGNSDIALSIVKPDQYRPAIIDRISEDSRIVAGQIGSQYSVALKGLQQPVDWIRWGDLQIMLFVPYQLEVVPAA